MSRSVREKKLKRNWRLYLTKGKRWSRETVAREHGCRVEDVQRLIDAAGPSKVVQINRGAGRHCCWKPRFFEGQLPPAKRK